MKYIITADTKGWTVVGESSTAYVFDDRGCANRRWKDMKSNPYFTEIHTATADKVNTHLLCTFQKVQGEKPLFASSESNYDLIRLFKQAYKSNCIVEDFRFVVPDVQMQEMEFEFLEELDVNKTDGADEYVRVSVVREKKFGSKFYLSERTVRYDEMMTGREDVCEYHLHPYFYDFDLVKDIIFDEYDYDL